MKIVIVLVLLAALVVWLVSIYNGLVRLKNQCSNALSQIDVQLKRRHDLIPNLVETTKGYLAHEKETLQAVINARNSAKDLQQSGHSLEDTSFMKLLAQAENRLSQAIGQFYAVVENYPELKADSSTKALFDELTNTENRIGFARQHYNDSVMFYNNSREIFPNNLISGFFGFMPLQGLEFQDRSVIQKVPSVQLV